MSAFNISYFFIRLFTFPLRYLPYRALHALGRFLGTLSYYLLTDYRKKALSNLSLAKTLHLSPSQIVEIAKESFQNLAINCLEYPRLERDKGASSAIRCLNPEVAEPLYNQGKGVIFFCGHQANWEVLFLDGTSRMRGFAIGKAIKNRALYNWIVSIREKQGGKIIAPRNAIKEGLRALKSGAFLGIVGDQGMPGSGYSAPFFGRTAWTSPAPALLAYRTQSPLLFAETRRVKGSYELRYSEPIWPNPEAPLEEEIPRLMGRLLSLLEESIRRAPGQWLWQHNRWKQEGAEIVYRRFRKDAIACLLPRDRPRFEALLPHLSVLKEIYPLTPLFAFAPRGEEHRLPPLFEETFAYEKLDETLRDDYRFKLLFDFEGYPPLKRHYLKRSAFEVLTWSDLQKIAPQAPKNPSDLLKRALCRPGTLWTPG